ncbi:hypothetical protein BLA29_007146 [Euroglyphus maynei]|uniref:Phorbol-ester/DAG-type domain-containing protein n=1 Tax=Euroglyphus maynei TaxID=6958 RepID=A0A1Y3ANG5_EURMA|nr:hypothetical protein BLA29_007146 [Euroglyphus maynei]
MTKTSTQQSYDTTNSLLPNKMLLNVYMPNQQRTIVEINHNQNNPNGGLQQQTIRDALMRAMKKRRLTTDVCYVKPIDWDIEVSRLVSRNIEVRIISHETRREFFPLANCDLCRKLLFHGHRCQACGIRYHLRCEQLISPICRAGQHSIHKMGRPHHLKNRDDLNGNNDGSGNNTGSGNNKQDIKRTNSEPDRINIINTDQTTTTLEQNNHNNNDLISNNRPRSADEKLHIDSNRESIRDWEIPQSEIIVRECIGSGSYGTVFRGHWHGPVALKKLKVAEPTQAQLLVFSSH